MINSFMRADEVAQELGALISYACKEVKRLNAELSKLGYLTVSGRASKQYFMEKACYSKRENEKEGK